MNRYAIFLGLGYLAALALLSSGCAAWFRGVTRSSPETRAAAALVWEHYGGKGPAPGVRFKYPEDIRERDRCKGRLTGRTGFLDVFTNVCVAGQTAPVGNGGCAILVIIEKGEKPSTTALAHELLHCMLLQEWAPLPHHTQGKWSAPAERDGYFFGRVDTANTRLVEAGL